MATREKKSKQNSTKIQKLCFANRDIRSYLKPNKDKGS